MKLKINLRNTEGVKAFYPLIMDCKSDLDLSIDRYTVDAKSLLGVLSLSVDKDLMLTIHEKAEGEALKIRDLMRDNGFLVEQR